jgi:hypothetical protein
MQAESSAAGSAALVFVREAIAVIVQTVADLLCNALEWVTLLGNSVGACGSCVEALPLAARQFAKVIVYYIIAVIVQAITSLFGPWVDGWKQRLAVRSIFVPVTIVIRVDAVFETVEIVVGEAFVKGTVAVIIGAVTDLFSLGKDIGVKWCAVLRVRAPVPIAIEVARIASAVFVLVFLGKVGHQRTVVVLVIEAVAVDVQVAEVTQSVTVQIVLSGIEEGWASIYAIRDPVTVRIGVAKIAGAVAVTVSLPRVHLGGAIVYAIFHSIPIEVLVYAIGNSIVVRVEVALIRHIVAVVVHAVAQLGGAGECRGITRQTILLVQEAVVIIVWVDAVRKRIKIGIDETLVHQAVAIVIEGVAYLLCSRVDLLVQGGAIIPVARLVIVVVRVAGVAGHIQVGVQLVGIGHTRAVVLEIEDAIAIFVVFQAVGDAIQVGILEPIVHHVVAIVVQPVANFRLGVSGIAQ